MGVRKLNTGENRRTKLGMALEQSAKEILAHVKGEVKLPTRRIVLPDEVDVKRIRTKAGMSQAEFARAFCLNPRTLQEWEQGRRKTWSNDPRIPRGDPQEPRGGVGRIGIMIFMEARSDGSVQLDGLASCSGVLRDLSGSG